MNVELQTAFAKQARTVLDTLPKIAGNGTLTPPQWKKERHLPPKYVVAALNRRFPDAPICRPADSPEKRAAAAMKAAKVTPAMSTRVENGAIIDVLLKELVMAVFATTQVVFALYVHEVVTTPSGAKGVRMICPGCKSNSEVKPPGVSGHDFPNAGAQKASRTFAGTLSSWKVPRRWPTKKVVIADDGWDEATSREHCPNGASFITMDDRILVAGEQGRELREIHWCIRFRVLSSSTGQGAHATRIHSQCEGQFLCMDGTWRIGLRVIDSPDCLCFLLGEDAKVHSYGAVQSERKEEIYLLLNRYAERRRRNGTLLALEWVYDDLCCRGADDVTKG
ncbi:unnamed protein product [Ectocarpus sp. CCAP 1310/34]|nr:unnamed protein product [Ectocarpus sp. CCAP 1310/34]